MDSVRSASGRMASAREPQGALLLGQRLRAELDSVWCGVLVSLGLRLRRSTDAFVSYDGAGTLWIAPDVDLDAEDTLAQLIFHEVCHWAIEGEEAVHRVDWGFGPPSQDTAPEQRCLELQAAAARHFGLERLLRPTTEFAPWYDQALMREGERLDPLQVGRFAPVVLQGLTASRQLIKNAERA